MARADRKRRGCFVYLGATLLVVSTLVPVVQMVGRINRPSPRVTVPDEIHFIFGSFYNLSRDPSGIRSQRLDEFWVPEDIAEYYAVMGQTCLPGEGVGEFFGLLALSVVAAGCFHLRLSRLLRIPFSGAVVWIAFTFWRFVSCMKTFEPPWWFIPWGEPNRDLLVAPWGWVAALAGMISR